MKSWGIPISCLWIKHMIFSAFIFPHFCRWWIGSVGEHYIFLNWHWTLNHFQALLLERKWCLYRNPSSHAICLFKLFCHLPPLPSLGTLQILGFPIKLLSLSSSNNFFHLCYSCTYSPHMLTSAGMPDSLPAFPCCPYGQMDIEKQSFITAHLTW